MHNKKILIYRTLLSILAYLLPTKITSYLIFLTSKKIYNKKKHTILVVSRDLFSKDMNEIYNKKQYNFIVINIQFMGYIQRFFIPKKYQVQTKFQKYIKNNLESWSRSIRLGENLIKLLSKKYKLSLVIDSNFDYWQSEFIRQAINKKIPYLVLCRENPVFKFQKKLLVKYFKTNKFKSTANKICVFSESAKDIYAKSNIINQNKIIVTGSPRLDAYRRLKMNNKKYITLISFLDKNYFSSKTFKDILIMLLNYEISFKKKNLNIFIKCKNREDAENVNLILKNYNLSFSNINVDYKTDLPSILSKSVVAITFNSFSFVECVLAKIKILIPNWDNKVSNDYLMVNPELIKEKYNIMNNIIFSSKNLIL